MDRYKNQIAETLFGASTAGWSPGADDGRPEREHMKEFRIENNRIYSNSGICETTHIFEIVEKIPKSFFVWNIGENMGSDEYIPIATDLRPGVKDDYRINPASLKAIKLNPEEVKALRKAAGYGINSKDTAEKALKSKRTGRMADRKRKEAEATIEIFNRITE